ncbi:MAG: hypothetical protein ACM3ZE_11260 [Myxococcales bacterium]
MGHVGPNAKRRRVPLPTSGCVLTPLLESQATGDTGGGWSHRPVGLAMGRLGEVYVTSDVDGPVMAIGHDD